MELSAQDRAKLFARISQDVDPIHQITEKARRYDELRETISASFGFDLPVEDPGHAFVVLLREYRELQASAARLKSAAEILLERNQTFLERSKH